MNTPTSSFWREPMAWLVFAIPLASIFAGVGLVVTAIRAGGADAVSDEVRRISQIQIADLGPDQAAQRQGLVAVVRFADGTVEVLPASAGFDRSAPLVATFEHPLRAEEDRQVRLAPSASGWRVETPIDAGHDWLVQLAPDDGSWRLRGRLERGQQAARLAPSLAGNAQ